MKAFSESPSAHAERAGLILLLTEKFPRSFSKGGGDERNQTGILTSGLDLAPAFPIKW